MANAYFSIGYYDTAVTYAQKALELKNNLYPAYNIICLAYCAMQKPEESMKYYRLSVANGADAKALKEALDLIQSGGQYQETPCADTGQYQTCAFRVLLSDGTTVCTYRTDYL